MLLSITTPACDSHLCPSCISASVRVGCRPHPRTPTAGTPRVAAHYPLRHTMLSFSTYHIVYVPRLVGTILSVADPPFSLGPLSLSPHIYASTTIFMQQICCSWDRCRYVLDSFTAVHVLLRKTHLESCLIFASWTPRNSRSTLRHTQVPPL